MKVTFLIYLISFIIILILSQSSDAEEVVLVTKGGDFNKEEKKLISSSRSDHHHGSRRDTDNVKCYLTISSLSDPTANRRMPYRKEHAVPASTLPDQSCQDNNDIVAIDIPATSSSKQSPLNTTASADTVTKYFTKVQRGLENDNITLSSTYAFWAGEDRTDGSIFNYVQDADGNMAASLVDLTSNKVYQFKTVMEESGEGDDRSAGFKTHVTITASGDFPPEGEPSHTPYHSRDGLLSEQEPQQTHTIFDSPHFTASTSANDFSPDDSGNYIDVMVVWTLSAECNLSGLGDGCTVSTSTETAMTTLINLAISESNDAYSASDINTQLRLVCAYRHPDYVETSFEGSLNDITFNDALSDVREARELNGADAVAFIIDDSQYCGAPTAKQSMLQRWGKWLGGLALFLAYRSVKELAGKQKVA